jgi:hypothetical protein
MPDQFPDSAGVRTIELMAFKNVGFDKAQPDFLRHKGQIGLLRTADPEIGEVRLSLAHRGRVYPG